MNCHLLVPGLFVPADAGGATALPALETLLARGALRKLPGISFERWLAETFRIDARDELPLAALSLRGEGLDPGDAWWLRADPIHLRMHGDRIQLAGAEGLDVTAMEAAGLVAALNAHFAEEQLEFVAPTPLRWYVRPREEPRVRTTPPSEVPGRAIQNCLPEGADGARWRRIINEAQMLMHGHRCNEEREQRGAPTINSLWFWGAGRVPAVPRDAPYGAVWAADPLAAGIASTAGLELLPPQQRGAQVLAAARDRGSDRPHLLVLDALRAALCRGAAEWRRALADLELCWFAPLLEELRRGRLQSLTLHGPGPDRSYAATLRRLDALRFWRRRRLLQCYS